MKRLLAILICIILLSGCGSSDSNISAETGTASAEKSLLILGDSISAGFGLESREDGWPALISEKHDFTLYNYGLNGSAFSDGAGDGNAMVRRVNTLPEISPDIIILQGGSNDFMQGIEIGDADSRDSRTMTGALNLIVESLREKYPDAQIVGFTPWISDGSVNSLGLSTDDYRKAILKRFSDFGLPCYDAADIESNGILMNDADFRSQYCISRDDCWHLNAAGQAEFAEAFDAWLNDHISR